MEKKKDIYLKTPNSDENGIAVKKLTTGSINTSDIPGNITYIHSNISLNW